MAVIKGFMKDYLEVVKDFEKELSDTSFSDEWYLERYHGNESAYFYEEDDGIVGFICAVPVCGEFVDELKEGVSLGLDDLVGSSDLFFISSCIVEENYRSIGIASKLLEALLEDNLEKDFYVVCNEESSEVVLEHGFREIRTNVFFRERQETR